MDDDEFMLLHVLGIALVQESIFSIAILNDNIAT